MELEIQPDFRVNLARLKPGTHTFRFQATDALFREYGNTDVGPTHMELFLTVVRTETNADFQLHAVGTLQLNCDRCLEPYPLALDFRHRIVYSTDQSLKALQGEEVVFLAPGQEMVNLKQDVYDLLSVRVPYRKVPCESVQECTLCPPELKAILLNVEQTDLPNHSATDESDSDTAPEVVDARWAKLLALKKNQDN